MDHQHPERSRSSGRAASGFDGGREGPAPGRRTLTMQLSARPAAPTAGLLPASAAAPATATDAADDEALRALFDAAVRPDLPAAPAMQRKLAVGGAAAASAPPPTLGGGSPLPDELRSSMERSFSTDFSAVRVHESDAASAVGARAFARGDDLCFAPGQFDPASAGGRELVGHELAHVVQQREGRVAPTTAQGDAGIVADPALEAEADELGARAARGEVVATSASGAAGGGGAAIQRQIACNDPGVDTHGWQMAEWGHWLDGRGMTWNDLTGSGVVLPAVPNPPAANRVRSLAHHELLALQRDANVHNLVDLNAVHAEVARRTAATVASMVAAGVAPGDLDVALDMYGRLDGTGPGSVAVLHKLEWHDTHKFQYARTNVDPGQTSQQGLVYGPWRDAGNNAPSDNAGGGDNNVHTMSLNVVWLLACCHHGVSFRLYAPPTERALFRQLAAGTVNNATTNNPQRKLSALARELIALVGTGLYNVAPQHDPNMPPGFQDTWVLTPNPGAFDATMAQLSNGNNDFDLPQLTNHLAPHGIQVIQPATPAENAVTGTSGQMATLPQKETSLRMLWTNQMNAPTAQRVNLITQREQQITAITGEPLSTMRRRVLGTVTATFRCNYVTQPGQRLYVVGDLDELGAWNPARALPLAYGGAHWEAPVDVCKDQQIRYKYLVEDATGRHWEVGNDHVRNTTASQTFQDNWGGG